MGPKMVSIDKVRSQKVKKDPQNRRKGLSNGSLGSLNSPVGSPNGQVYGPQYCQLRIPN